MKNKRGAYGSARETVLTYVETQGPCTTRDISDAVGYGLARIGNILMRLRFDGLVDSVKTEDMRAATWAATAEGDESDDYPVRVTRKEWAGSTPRCEFERLLFGACT